MKKSWLALLPLFLVALISFSGCGTGVKLVSITVNITELTPNSDNTAKMVVRYVNENVTSFAVESSKHKVYLNGQYVGVATTKDPVGLLQLNQTTQTLTLKVEKPEALSAATGQSVAYRVDSELAVQVGDDIEKLKSSSSGQVTVGAK